MEQKMKELMDLLATLKSQLDNGTISKESFEERIKELKSEITALQAKQKELQDQLALRATAMDGLDHEIKNGKVKFSLAGFLRGVSGLGWDKSNEAERKIVGEYMDLINKTPMSTSTGSGGYSIPPQAIMNFIDALYAKTVLVEAGATLMTNLSGSPVTIPKQNGKSTAYWVAENSAITESSIGDAQISMTPKEVAALVKLSNKLLMLSGSNPSIEALIVADLQKQLRLAIDLAGLRGNASNTPVGIAVTSNINDLNLGDNGDYMDWDDLLDMQTELELDDALEGKLAYIMHPKVKNRLKKTRIPQFSGDTGGAYIVPPIISDAMLKDMAGYPILTTTQIPVNLTKGSGENLSEVYFGNFADLLIGQWGGLDIMSSNQAGDSSGGAFSANQTWIRAIQSVDIAVRRTESFCLSNEVKTV